MPSSSSSPAQSADRFRPTSAGSRKAFQFSPASGLSTPDPFPVPDDVALYEHEDDGAAAMAGPRRMPAVKRNGKSELPSARAGAIAGARDPAPTTAGDSLGGSRRATSMRRARHAEDRAQRPAFVGAGLLMLQAAHQPRGGSKEGGLPSQELSLPTFEKEVFYPPSRGATDSAGWRSARAPRQCDRP